MYAFARNIKYKLWPQDIGIAKMYVQCAELLRYVKTATKSSNKS